MKPYFNRRDGLSVMQGCILWGSRVVVPPKGRECIVDELHDTHPGRVKIKIWPRAMCGSEPKL